MEGGSGSTGAVDQQGAGRSCSLDSAASSTCRSWAICFSTWPEIFSYASFSTVHAPSPNTGSCENKTRLICCCCGHTSSCQNTARLSCCCREPGRGEGTTQTQQREEHVDRCGSAVEIEKYSGNIELESIHRPACRSVSISELVRVSISELAESELAESEH